MIFLLWFIFSLGVGMLGAGKNIGFWGAFLIALILSPLIGFIVVLCSSTKVQYVYPPTQPVQTTKPKPQVDVADQLGKFKVLLDSGAITEDEFNEQKRKLLGQY